MSSQTNLILSEVGINHITISSKWYKNTTLKTLNMTNLDFLKNHFLFFNIQTAHRYCWWCRRDEMIVWWFWYPACVFFVFLKVGMHTFFKVTSCPRGPHRMRNHIRRGHGYLMCGHIRAENNTNSLLVIKATEQRYNQSAHGDK